MSTAFLLSSSLGMALASSSSPVVPNLPFGATFPMLGSGNHDGSTWSGNVYYGTSLIFNPGFTPAFTNVYNVPVYNTDSSSSSGSSGSGSGSGSSSSGTSGSGSGTSGTSGTSSSGTSGSSSSGSSSAGNTGGSGSTGGATSSATSSATSGSSSGSGNGQGNGNGQGSGSLVEGPDVDPTGQYCTVISSTSGCPKGWYCKANYGYNTYGVGTCQRTPNSYPEAAGGGAANGPWSPVPQTPPKTVMGSCTGACGFQTLSKNAECWCDEACQDEKPDGKGNDCCHDFETECPLIYLWSNSVVYNVIQDDFFQDEPVFLEPVCGPFDCETSKTGFENDQPCHCDTMCLEWDDCCHDYKLNCQ